MHEIARALHRELLDAIKQFESKYKQVWWFERGATCRMKSNVSWETFVSSCDVMWGTRDHILEVCKQLALQNDPKHYRHNPATMLPAIDLVEHGEQIFQISWWPRFNTISHFCEVLDRLGWEKKRKAFPKDSIIESALVNKPKLKRALKIENTPFCACFFIRKFESDFFPTLRQSEKTTLAELSDLIFLARRTLHAILSTELVVFQKNLITWKLEENDEQCWVVNDFNTDDLRDYCYPWPVTYQGWPLETHPDNLRKSDFSLEWYRSQRMKS